MAKSGLRAMVSGSCLIALLAVGSCKSEGGAKGGTVVVYASVGKAMRVFALNTESGVLEQRSVVENLVNDVHYAAMHPNTKVLYLSLSESPTPVGREYVNRIYAFSVDGKTGALTQLGEPFAIPTPALSRAINISVDGTGGYLLMAHNFSEAVSVVKLQADGALGELVTQPMTPKLGTLVHQIRVDPSNQWALVPVRGNDSQSVTAADGGVTTTPEQPGHVYSFSFNAGVLTLSNTLDFETMVGPRHLDFHPTRPWVYVTMERGNQLQTYSLASGALTKLFGTTTLGDTTFKYPAQRAGAIHVHPNGKWVYVANRNVAPCAASVPCATKDTTPFVAGENNIAVFSLDATTGEPTMAQRVDTRGFEARSFTLDPTGNFLVVGNQMNIARKEGDAVVDVQPNLSVFRLDSDGKLTFVKTYDQAGGQVWWVGAYKLPG